MSRVNVEQNRHQGSTFVNGSKMGVARIVMGGTVVIPKDAPTMLFLDANGVARNADFPAVTPDMLGLFFVLKNIAGGAFAITIRNSAAATLGDLLQGESCMVVCDGTAFHVLFVGANT